MIGRCAYCTPECIMCQGKPTVGRETRDRVTGVNVFRGYSYACLMRTVDAHGNVTTVKPDSRNAWKRTA